MNNAVTKISAVLATVALGLMAFAGPQGAVAQAKVLFGEGVKVFTPAMPAAEIDAVVEGIFKKQHKAQFGTDRYALLFLPGDYTACKPFNIGYYTQVLGLGRTPHEVKLTNIKTPAALPNNNATCNFWVGVENFRIVDTDNNADPYFNFQWGVSQAAPARRLYVERKSVFDWFYGWASGGYVADCVFEKPAGSYSQQQYYYRNCDLRQGTYGVNWNKVIQGCGGAADKDTKSWRDGGCTTLLATSEVIREKPFLFWDEKGASFKVFVPAFRRAATGVTWGEGEMGQGQVLDVVTDFHVARADRDTAATMNAALAAGKNLLLSPGIYHVAEPLKVTKANTVVLGLGEATIVPENDRAALLCADVDGLVIAGLVFDAERASQRFVVMGERKTGVSHAANPSILIDLIYRVGGTGKPGKTEVCLEVNSNDVLIDQTWIWRADHGDHTGWTANTSRNGLVVNGDRVIGYGLFVEHFQEHDVLWNGEDGKTYFLQNEKCYDPQGQELWMSHNGQKKGWAAYKVADHVKRHHAIGLGVYDVMINTSGHSIHLEDAIEVPDTPGVVIENACIVEISNGDGPIVGINHIVNGTGFGVKTGKGSGGGYGLQRVYRYSDGKSDVAPDYYLQKK